MVIMKLKVIQFVNVNNLYIKECHINCKTCSEYEKCLSCSNEKLLVNNECVCKPNFYLYKSNFIYTCKCNYILLNFKLVVNNV